MQPSFLTHQRAGDRPRTTPTNPHTQLTQNAPADLQERTFAHARAMADVVVGPSRVSVPGARAFHLPASTVTRRDAFLIEREFAHLHPTSDGSLHLVLSPTVIDQVIANGWAERHPLAGQAKDMGSAAVFVALAMSALCWAVIAGPTIGGWILVSLR